MAMPGTVSNGVMTFMDAITENIKLNEMEVWEILITAIGDIS